MQEEGVVVWVWGRVGCSASACAEGVRVCVGACLGMRMCVDGVCAGVWMGVCVDACVGMCRCMDGVCVGVWMGVRIVAWVGVGVDAWVGTSMGGMCRRNGFMHYSYFQQCFVS